MRLANLAERVQGEAHSAGVADEFELYQAAEFDLTIDYRLGIQFPKARRKVLRDIQQRYMLEAKKLKARFLAGHLTKELFADAMQNITHSMLKQFSLELSAAEMSAFFGGDEKTLTLPLVTESL